MTASAPPLPAPAAVMARAAGENFPVASRVLPRRIRGHLLALYGFARLVDEAGDEAAGDRLALLDWIEADLDRAYRGAAEHPLLRSLEPTLRECAIPPEILRRLVEANRVDQAVASYETFEDLLGYCHLSANPVGEAVLHVLGVATPDRVARSDAVCTGLQLAEHWQDVREDLARGRVYLPAADLERFGCAPADLAADPLPGPARALMAFEVARARVFLADGAPLVRMLRGRAALAVAAFVAGGRAALDAVERTAVRGVGPWPPTAGRAARLAALARTLAGARRT